MAKTPAKKLQEKGVALFRKGKLEAALKTFQEALEAAGDDTLQTAFIYNDLGVTYKQLENIDEAYDALHEAMERFVALDHKKGQAQTIGNMASVLEADGELDDAIEHYKQSATMLEALGEHEAAMYTRQAVSKLRLKQKEYLAALAAYEEGIQNMPEGSFKRKLLQKLMNIPNSMISHGG